MDAYEQVRSLPFSAVVSALGIATAFKQRKNGEWYGTCPIHHAKTNNTSFSYAPDGRFHCFSCQAKGRGTIDFVKLVRKVGFQEAVEWLKAEVGSNPLPVAETHVLEAPSEPQPILKDTWRNYQVPCEWLDKRVPDIAVRERYGVFAYNNPARKSAYSGRVMLPVRDLGGVLYGYLGRSTQDNPDTGSGADIPKYLFPKNLPKSHFLFGAFELQQSHGQERQRIVYLVEGAFAVMRLAMFGVPVVSAYGWSVSDEQIDILAKLAKGVCYLPDRNKAQECAGVVHRLAQRLWVKAPSLPEGVDDPEYLTEAQLKAL